MVPNELVARRAAAPGFGQIDEDDVAELALRVVGDPDPHDVRDRRSGRRTRARWCRPGRPERSTRQRSRCGVARGRIGGSAGEVKRARAARMPHLARARLERRAVAVVVDHVTCCARAWGPLGACAASIRSASSASSPRCGQEPGPPDRPPARPPAPSRRTRAGSAASNRSGMSLTTIRSPRARASRSSAVAAAEHLGVDQPVEVGERRRDRPSPAGGAPAGRARRLRSSEIAAEPRRDGLRAPGCPAPAPRGRAGPRR